MHTSYGVAARSVPQIPATPRLPRLACVEGFVVACVHGNTILSIVDILQSYLSIPFGIALVQSSSSLSPCYRVSVTTAFSPRSSTMPSSTPIKGSETRNAEEPQSPTSTLWQAAIEKHYSELAKFGIKASVVDKDLWNTQSPDELIAQINAVGPVPTMHSNTWTKALNQLQPILLGFNDFATVTARVMGTNGKVAAMLWGSIRLIIKVCFLQHRGNVACPRPYMFNATHHSFRSRSC